MTVSSYMTQSVAVAEVEAALVGTARVLTLLVCHLSVGQFIMTAKWQAMMCYECVCVCFFLCLLINAALKLKLDYSPSTLARASTEMVCRAGTAQATKWNKCDLFSIASWPHLRPAARNQANARHDHHAKAAMQQKYSAMNKTVHAVVCR